MNRYVKEATDPTPLRPIFIKPDLTLGACPRCKGDVETTRDTNGPHRRCLQCGWYQDLDLPEPAPGNRHKPHLPSPRKHGQGHHSPRSS